MRLPMLPITGFRQKARGETTDFYNEHSQIVLLKCGSVRNTEEGEPTALRKLTVLKLSKFHSPWTGRCPVYV